jgi:hypothetical protein
MIELEDALLDAFQLLPLGEETLPPPGVAWRALYLPTFHVDCVVEVRPRGEGGELLVVVAAPGFRHWWMEGRGWLGRPPDPARPAPDDFTVETARFDAAQIAGLAAALGQIDAPGLTDQPPDHGRDGISLLGEAREGGRCSRFTAWSPTAREHPRHHGYFVALARLAVATLPPGRARRAVEECLRYL